MRAPPIEFTEGEIEALIDVIASADATKVLAEGVTRQKARARLSCHDRGLVKLLKARSSWESPAHIIK